MVAPNLEVSTLEGGLDDTVEELIELARENEALGTGGGYCSLKLRLL